MLALLLSPRGFARGDDTVPPAQAVVVGVNVVNPMLSSIAGQDATIVELSRADIGPHHKGVAVVRASFAKLDAEASVMKIVDYAKRLGAHGIRLELILPILYPADVPTRPYQPAQFPRMWGGHPLSTASPNLSEAYYRRIISELDKNGIELAGIELGNEINWTAFNAEFPLPGKGYVFGLSDLYHDPEAMQIARGYLRYLQVLAGLKDVRDHSRLNRNTSIISAGLPDFGPEGPRRGSQEDAVTVSATLQFLRANGLDNLVDAYGIHTYPPGNGPGDAAADANRRQRFERYTVAQCRGRGASDGRPCWITEWGFRNTDTSCPPNEADRSRLIADMRGIFKDFSKQGRLVGLIYYDWSGDANWSKENRVDPSSIFRCGVLTDSGKLALAPW